MVVALVVRGPTFSFVARRSSNSKNKTNKPKVRGLRQGDRPAKRSNHSAQARKLASTHPLLASLMASLMASSMLGEQEGTKRRSQTKEAEDLAGSWLFCAFSAPKFALDTISAYMFPKKEGICPFPLLATAPANNRSSTLVGAINTFLQPWRTSPPHTKR